MPIQNSDVAGTFEKVADLLEIEGENRFRVRAYRDAARTVGGHSRSVAEMVKQDEDLTELSGIGEDLADKTREIVETGKLSQAEELEKKTDRPCRAFCPRPQVGLLPFRAVFRLALQTQPPSLLADLYLQPAQDISELVVLGEPRAPRCRRTTPLGLGQQCVEGPLDFVACVMRHGLDHLAIGWLACPVVRKKRMRLAYSRC